MLHLLRAELYRHPRRMMVLVSLAVLLVIAATNAFSIFQPSLAEEREKLHILASAGARPERLAEIARDNWHYGFVQAFGDLNHMMLVTLLTVNLPLALDLSIRRNDELFASVVAALTVKGMPLDGAVGRAVEFTAACIAATPPNASASGLSRCWASLRRLVNRKIEHRKLSRGFAKIFSDIFAKPLDSAPGAECSVEA